MANLKSIKKGDKVIMRMFTGAFIEAKVVEMSDAKKIGFTCKSGVKMTFSKETGKQISPEPKSEKFANYLEEYDKEVEKAEIAKKANKSKKATPAPTKKAQKADSKSKKAAVEAEEEDEEFEEVDSEDEEVEDEVDEEDEEDGDED